MGWVLEWHVSQEGSIPSTVWVLLDRCFKPTHGYKMRTDAFKYAVVNSQIALEAKTIRIADVLSGNFTHCILMNYMFDVPWLVQQCRRLQDVHALFVHGERSPERYVCACVCVFVHLLELVDDLVWCK